MGDVGVGDVGVGGGVVRVAVGKHVGCEAAREDAADGSTGGIASESGDIVSHPFQGESGVAQTDVPGLTRGTGVAEDVNAGIGRNDDEVVLIS